MTKPKRQVGNPLGESGLSNREKIDWEEAHYFAEQLHVRATELLKYTEGKETEAYHYSCLMTATRLYAAMESALSRRRARLDGR